MSIKPKAGVKRLLSQLYSRDWMGAAIDRHFERSRPETWRAADPTIHPSSLGGVCALEFELGLLGHRTKADGQGVRRMENGTFVGRRWVETFKEMGVLVSFEERVKSEDPLISGSIDVIVKNPQTGDLAIGEIKSINQRGFSRLPTPTADRVANMRALAIERKGYCLQLAVYMHLRSLPGFFLFENKDSQEYRLYWVEAYPELLDEVFAAGSVPKTAQETYFTGRLVPPPFRLDSLTCKKCSRNKICQRLQEGDVDTWNLVKEQFRRAKVEPKEPEEQGWPVFGPRRL